MTQLMNLPASFEPNRGSGRRCDLLAVNFRAITLSPSRRGRPAAISVGDSRFEIQTPPFRVGGFAVGIRDWESGSENPLTLFLLRGARGGSLLALRPVLG